MAKGYFEDLNKHSFKWEDFVGKKNTRDVVERKAFALSSAMSSLLGHAIDIMRKTILTGSDFEVDEEKWWTIYYDFLIFLIHISDREAFEFLDKNQRTLFIESLLNKVIETCSSDFVNNSVNQFKQKFLHNFILFQDEFASYERGKTKYLAQNVTYMFAERIQKRMGFNSTAILKAQIFEFTINLELLLDIPRLLNNKASDKKD